MSYTAQSGEKGAPLNVYTLSPPNSYWRWPRWDIGNLYWLSSTALGEATLKTTLFYNQFKNDLFAYDDKSYTTQSANGRFRSYYDDTGTGGSVELDTPVRHAQSLRRRVPYRHDEHTEYNDNRPTNPTARTIEPVQTNDQNTWSVAVEDTFSVNSKLDLVGGVSHDANDLNKAEEYGVPPPGASPPSTTAILYNYPTGGSDREQLAGRSLLALRGRPANPRRDLLAHSVPDGLRALQHAFRQRRAESGLGSRACVELRARLVGAAQGHREPVDGAVLCGRAGFDPDGDLAVGAHAGAERRQRRVLRRRARRAVEAHRALEHHRELHVSAPRDQGRAAARARGHRCPEQPGVPAFLFTPSSHWTITPNVEVAGDQWSETATANQNIRTGSHTLLGFQAQYRGGERWEVSVGGTNLLDENYEQAWGYPDQGRSTYVRMRLNF